MLVKKIKLKKIKTYLKKKNIKTKITKLNKNKEIYILTLDFY